MLLTCIGESQGRPSATQNKVTHNQCIIGTTAAYFLSCIHSYNSSMGNMCMILCKSLSSSSHLFSLEIQFCVLLLKALSSFASRFISAVPAITSRKAPDLQEGALLPGMQIRKPQHDSPSHVWDARIWGHSLTVLPLACPQFICLKEHLKNGKSSGHTLMRCYMWERWADLEKDPIFGKHTRD